MAWNDGQYSWGTFGSGFTGTVQDSELMSLIQNALLEPDDAGATWPSGLWTRQEVLDYMNDRVRRFLSESGLTMAVQYQGGVANQGVYNLPNDLIDLRRFAWRRGPTGGEYKELIRLDPFTLDNGVEGWPTATADEPEFYTDIYLQSLQVQVVPAPTDMGDMEATYVALGAQLQDGQALYHTINLPNDWSWPIAYGVMADMLGKECEASDPIRSEYCEQRFSEGIELARILLTGGLSA